MAAGLTEREVLGRARMGRLHRLHRGVYAVGHPGLSKHGIWMAAVLACDAAGWTTRAPNGTAAELKAAARADAAFLSHGDAAALWGLLAAGDGPVDVTVRGTSGRARRSGLRVHRSITLTERMTTRREGIPVTTPARTIADLRSGVGGAVSPRRLRRAIRQAAVLGLPLEEPAEHSRSDLELAFRRLCRANRLPQPEMNADVDGIEVDFLWRRSAVVVETDGYRYHRGRIAFEDDRGRDLALRELGFEVVRLSETQVEEEPVRVAALLRRLVAPEA